MAKKKVSKKTSAKKSTAKKASVKKAAAAKTPKAKAASTNPIKQAMTKSQIYAALAEETGLSKKEVTAVMDAYTSLIERHVKKNGAGEFKMPGLFKVRVIKKPAVKARKGVNPFTGEEMMFKAKPARNVVKILPLKAMKDMAS